MYTQEQVQTMLIALLIIKDTSSIKGENYGDKANKVIKEFDKLDESKGEGIVTLVANLK